MVAPMAKTCPSYLRPMARKKLHPNGWMWTSGDCLSHHRFLLTWRFISICGDLCLCRCIMIYVNSCQVNINWHVDIVMIRSSRLPRIFRWSRMTIPGPSYALMLPQRSELWLVFVAENPKTNWHVLGYTMIYHDIPWYTMIYHDIPWHTTIYHDLPHVTIQALKPYSTFVNMATSHFSDDLANFAENIPSSKSRRSILAGPTLRSCASGGSGRKRERVRKNVASRVNQHNWS